MNQLDILAEEVLIKVDGKRTMCKAVLVSDRGGHIVSYLVDGVEIKSQPLYRSPFKYKVKELKTKQEQSLSEQTPKPVSEPESILSAEELEKKAGIIRETCKTAGVTQQQLASQYGIPLLTLEAWFGGTPPAGYVVTLLLRCLAIDFPTEPVKKPAYTLHTSWGKRLTDKEIAYVDKERACDRVSLVSEDENNPNIKQYRCNEDGFIFEIRRIKEEV